MVTLEKSSGGRSVFESSAVSETTTTVPLGMTARRLLNRTSRFSRPSRDRSAETTPYGYAKFARRSAAARASPSRWFAWRWWGWRNRPSCQWIRPPVLMIYRPTRGLDGPRAAHSPGRSLARRSREQVADDLLDLPK